VFIPKSEVVSKEKLPDGTWKLTIPEWLAEDRGLI